MLVAYNLHALITHTVATANSNVQQLALLVGASLSEPHIDHNNVPRCREFLYVMYLAACSVCLPQCSREHAYSINNT